MSDPVTLDGYGTTATLTGNTLTVTATNAVARGALGAATRTITLTDITALELNDATALRNGSLVIESSAGKTVIHYRRKQTASARELHTALQDRSTATPGAPVTAGYANEARDQRAARSEERLAAARARLAERQAELDAQRDQARAQFHAARTQMADTNRTLWADLRGAWHTTSPEAAELAAFLDALETPDPLDVGDERAAHNDDTDPTDPAGQTGPPAPTDRSVTDLTDAALDEAEVAATAGDTSQEERLIRWARTIARTQGKRPDRRTVDDDIARRTRHGTLRIGAQHLGTITSENAFDRWARTGGLTGGSRGEKRIDIWTDRIITASAAYPITARTGAQVYLDGQLIVTSRPTLTRMALFAPLPGTTLIPGLAFQKKETKDRRRAELHIRDVNWALTAALDPDALSTPRQLAEQINTIATGIAHQPAPATGPELLSQLERLTYLIETGAITDAQAQAIRTALLR